jgi:ribosome-associated protein
MPADPARADGDEVRGPTIDEPTFTTAAGRAGPVAGEPTPPASRNRAGLPARTEPAPPADRPPLDIARRIVELAEDKKAVDIVLLEIGHLTTLADYLVICSGGSERQLGAIGDGIVEGLKADGTPILGREGEPVSHWILLDVGSVVVHVFAPPERDFYGLERLWPEARTILRLQ